MVRIFLFCFLAGILVGCGNSPTTSLPDRQPETAVILPTNSPTFPTPTATASPGVSPIPPTEPPATPTLTATPAPTLTPEEIVYSVSISSPQPGEQIPVDTPYTFHGTVNPVPPEGVAVQMSVASREVLAGLASVEPDGRWSFTTSVNPNVVGGAEFGVRLVGEPISKMIEVMLKPTLNGTNPAIMLSRPLFDGVETAVAGHIFFFEGRVNNPIGERVTITVQTNNCEEIVAYQSFDALTGPWRGVVILPLEASGAACAIAQTGDSAAHGSWRQVRVPINILQPEDEGATRVQLGNSQPLRLSAAEDAYLFGLAVNAINLEVELTLQSDDALRETVAEGVATVDEFGFWEVELSYLVSEVVGPAILLMQMNTAEGIVEQRTAVVIEP